MSSTARGYDRHKADYYVTPQAPIKDFLSVFLQDEQIDRPDRMLWLDPCAGGCAQSEMSYPTVIERDLAATVMTMDIREDSRAEHHGDYLAEVIQEPRPDIIITNPPFNLALPIIKKALQDVAPGGYVIMLLRLNFFGSLERKPFFEENMPKYCYIHSKRMNFIPKWLQEQIKEQTGKAPTGDSIEYAHFVWQKGFRTDKTLTAVI